MYLSLKVQYDCKKKTTPNWRINRVSNSDTKKKLFRIRFDVVERVSVRFSYQIAYRKSPSNSIPLTEYHKNLLSTP